MLKSKSKKLPTATAEQADMVDLKKCRKVIDHSAKFHAFIQCLSPRGDHRLHRYINLRIFMILRLGNSLKPNVIIT